MGSQKVRDFFEKLSKDDDFRQSVIDDPAAILTDWDIDYDPDEIPDEVELPTKQDIVDKIDEYVDQFGDEPVSFAKHKYRLT